MDATIVKCGACGTRNRIPAAKRHLQAKCGKCGHLLEVRTTPVVELNEVGFQDLVQHSSLPVLVDFYSPTCGPCQMLAPTIASLARRYAGRLIVAKLDTSRFPAVAARYRLSGVPTLLFFYRGEVVDQVAGVAGEEMLARKITAFLART